MELCGSLLGFGRDFHKRLRRARTARPAVNPPARPSPGPCGAARPILSSACRCSPASAATSGTHCSPSVPVLDSADEDVCRRFGNPPGHIGQLDSGWRFHGSVSRASCLAGQILRGHVRAGRVLPAVTGALLHHLVPPIVYFPDRVDASAVGDAVQDRQCAAEAVVSRS